MPVPSGVDGAALIEEDGVAAFRPIKESYVVPPFNISSFQAVTPVVEVGTVVTDPQFTAAYTQPPDSASVNDEYDDGALDVSDTPTAFTYHVSNPEDPEETWSEYNFGTGPQSVTFTLTAAKDGEDPVTRNATITWLERMRWGVELDDSDFPGSYEELIQGLTNNALASTRARVATLTPGFGEHIYFAIPSNLGLPTFTVGGFQGGFVQVGSFFTVEQNGIPINYTLWKSVQSNLGETTVQVS